MKKITAIIFISSLVFSVSCKKNDKDACAKFHKEVMKMYSTGVIKEKLKQHYAQTFKKASSDGMLCKAVVVMKPYTLTKDEKADLSPLGGDYKFFVFDSDSEAAAFIKNEKNRKPRTKEEEGMEREFKQAGNTVFIYMTAKDEKKVKQVEPLIKAADKYLAK